MSAQDQLEIINAQGNIRFHDLNMARGITNIGRHPDNDIVIESEAVAPFHAILDHQSRPYRLIALNPNGVVKVSGQVLQPNIPKELRNWDTIELDGTSIILMEGGAATGQPAPTLVPAPLPVPTPPFSTPAFIPPAAPLSPTQPAPLEPDSLGDMDELDRLLAMLPEDRVDDVIIVEPVAQNGMLDAAHPSSLDFSVDVEQPATMQIAVTNGGDLVGEFHLEVRGIDPTWVTVTPASINLFDGQRGNFSIAVTAPRLPSSRAKAHYFSVVVSSPTYPGRFSSTAGLVILNPFYDYAVGDIDPKKQKIAWSKKVGQAVLPITNLGNGPMPLQISGEDDRHAATIEFDSPEEGIKLVNQLQLTVPPEETLPVAVFVTPRKRRFIAFGGENINFTLTVTPTVGTEQTPRSVLAQANALPFMGPIPIILMVLLLGLLLVFFFTPRILRFEADKVLISAGESSTLNWQSSAFTTLKLDPGDGKPVESPVGNLAVSPKEDTTYTLTAETFLTAILPQWFRATQTVSIKVEPVLPVIRVFETTGGESVLTGSDVTVSWDVGNADSLILSINGADDTIPADQHTGTRTLTVERDTIFTLRAFNAYTAAEGVTQSVTVKSVVPTPVPPPKPLIRQFEVSPLDIFFGQEVTIKWAVDGATKVTISGVEGELPPEGSVTVRPDSDTGYVLTATNGVDEITSQVQQVIVSPPPTPTPAPNAPKIENFAAAPATVGIDSPESKNVQLSWSVTGDTTDIEIVGPSGLKYNGLPKQGTLRVVVSKASLYVLTAFNGTSLFSSSTAQVKVVNPVPKIDSITPSSSNDVGGTGLNITVIGSGFTKESKVQWAGSNRSTAYVSPTQLTASILAEDMTTAGTFEVKVFNPTPGGGTSGAATFTLNNPTPTLDSISPEQVFFGTSDTTLNVYGDKFVKGSIVRFGSLDLTTTFVSSTQLSARIPASQLNTAGSRQVSVVNPSPGGGTSSSLSFNVFSEVFTPSISSISPDSSFAGIDGITITINGANFTTSSRVQWKGVNLITNYVSENQLTASVPLANLGSVGLAKVTVANPPPVGAETVLSQVTSNAKQFTINPVTISFVDPIATSTPVSIRPVVVGVYDVNPLTLKNDITLKLSTPLVAPTTIQISSSNVSRLEIRQKLIIDPLCNTGASISSILVPANTTEVKLCMRGITTGLPAPIVTARLLAGLGGTQTSVTVPVNPTAPTINSISPDSSGQGAPTFTMTIVGTSFGTDISKVKVRWEGQAALLTPSSLTDTLIQVTIPVGYVAATGDYKVTVEVNGVGSTNSCANPNIDCKFTVGAASLLPLSPSTKVAGNAGFTLTLDGTNFVNGSSVQWWSASDCTGTLNTLTANFVNTTQLTAQISADLIKTDGTYCVKVLSPSSTTTGPQTFTVTSFATTFNSNSFNLEVGRTASVILTFGTTQNVSRTINLTSTASNITFRSRFLGFCTSTQITSITTSVSSTGTSFCIRADSIPSSPVTITADVAEVSETGGPETATVTVVQAAADLSIDPSPSSATVGQSVAFDVTISAVSSSLTPSVSASTPITISNGATTLCTITSVNSSGLGSCSALMTVVGNPLTLTASYPGDSNFSAVSENFDYTVSKANSTVTLSAGSPSGTSTYGQAVTFLARVATDTSAGNLNGTIDFKAGASIISTVTVTNMPVNTEFTGTLSYTDALFTDPNAGTYSITAVYTDTSGFYNDDTSNSLTHVIAKDSTSVTTPIASANPSKFGQGITFSTTVTSGTGNGTINGTVVFKDGSTTIASLPFSAPSGSTSTTSSISNLTVGSHSITAQFVDNVSPTNHFDSAVSGTLTQVVNKADTTTTSGSGLTATYSSSNQNLSVSATVTANSPSTAIVNEGAVKFTFPFGVSVTSGTVASGAASATYVIPGGTNAGTYSLQSDYQPIGSGASFNSSVDNDAAIELTINKASTSTTAGSGLTATYSDGSQSLTLTATVSSGSNTISEGTVTFTVKNGATTIGSSVTSGTVSSGSASASYTLPGGTLPGNYSIEAVYCPADNCTNFTTSSDTDAATELTVNVAPTTTVAATETATSNASDQNLTLDATVSSAGNTVNEGTVTFTVKTTGGGVVGLAVTSGTVSGGAASATYVLPGGTVAGSYNIEAVYNPAASTPKYASSSDVDVATELTVS